ncbi:sensory neuron membrane protein 2-like [Agrilus planipennis]|uniref:Sensory neuron membrane protein 2-like n=1 Tax=Agrilus planipennis TaxID=224129 RepID=A0A1W4X6R9_AGRPL|nr:sensory neuron membrane protein 2-like [Agrilus planipennis]
MKSHFVIIFVILNVAFLACFAGWYIVPEYLDGIVDKKSVVVKSTPVFESWKTPYDSTSSKFKIYFFNVTNPEQVENGGTPFLRQVGPYVYDVKIEHIDISENPADFSVDYFRKKTYYFNEIESIGKDTDRLTVLNIALMSSALALHEFVPQMLPDLSKTLPFLYPSLHDIFLRETVKNMVFDGITLHCEHEETEWLCSLLGLIQIKNLRPAPNGMDYVVSLMTNGSIDGPFEMYTGQDNLTKRGTLIKYEFDNELNAWTGECRIIKGSDGWFFPKPLEKEKGIDIFLPEICTHMHLSYERESKVNAVDTIRFSYKESDVSNLDCYCPKLYSHENGTSPRCPLPGLIDIKSCIDYSILVSPPHFYLSHHLLVDKVEGLTPEKSRHESYVEIDPITSTPLEACIRLQLNTEVVRISEFEYLSNVTEYIVFPLGWYEMAVKAKDNVEENVKGALFLYKVGYISKWVIGCVTILIAVIFLMTCTYYHCLSKEVKDEFSPSQNLTNSNNVQLNENGKFETRKI